MDKGKFTKGGKVLEDRNNSFSMNIDFVGLFCP